MEVFRIASEPYSRTLATSGSANRWNLKGQHVLYTGSSRALSTLELIVHTGAVKPRVSYKVMIISIADDDHLTRQIQLKDLPDQWRSLGAYSVLQTIGSDWYQTRTSLILKVPSAVIPLEYNYIINSEHPDFPDKVSLVGSKDYFWDSRLL